MSDASSVARSFRLAWLTIIALNLWAAHRRGLLSHARHWLSDRCLSRRYVQDPYGVIESLFDAP